MTGAIPFTGWMLDDVDVVARDDLPLGLRRGSRAHRSELWRRGADLRRLRRLHRRRPARRAAAFPTYPANTKAGWGFMVLTNMLPNQGNGTYVFHIYGQDRDGHTPLLGTRTMTCTNASATLPFGAIDTPPQGGSASGTQLRQLRVGADARIRRSIPIDGSTITVLVDGVSVGTADYNHFRPDIAAAVPGLANSNGAVGLQDHRHDDADERAAHDLVGRARQRDAIEGIGSRFFTVANGGGARDGRRGAARAPRPASGRVRRPIASAPQDETPVLGRRGWDLEAPVAVSTASAAPDAP